MNEKLASQVIGLPEDILKKKWAGDFAGAQRAIDAHLSRDLPALMRERLTLERELIRRLPHEYIFDKARAVAEVMAHVPDFTEAEFDQIEAEGGIDFLFVQGEKRYFKHLYPMLMEWDRGFIARSGGTPSSARPVVDEAIAEMKREGKLSRRIHMRHELRVNDDAFVPGQTYRVHLPVPKPCAQQSNILIHAQPSGLVSGEDSPQRSVYYERRMDQNEPFVVEYAYDSAVRYVDLMNGKAPDGPLYPNEAPPCADDLSEIAPHLVFTPYLRALAREVRGELNDPLRIARAAYDFVTTRVTYSYLRDYLLVDNVAEYVALNLKGDCGAQTLLFMALLRLNGVPARWQSGCNARLDSVGNHDWGQFYVEPYGWLLCDVSAGGGAKHAGSDERWNFFFGNLDPMRMVANSEYMGALEPTRVHLRNDPYDNQSGECETAERGLLMEEYTITRTLEELSE